MVKDTGDTGYCTEIRNTVRRYGILCGDTGYCTEIRVDVSTHDLILLLYIIVK